MSTVKTLADAFSSLPNSAKENLKYHLEEDTPIFCGLDSNFLYCLQGKV